MKEQVPAALAGERIDRAVAMLATCSRAEAAALLAGGRVKLSGAVVSKASTRVREGDELEVSGIHEPAPAAVAGDASVRFGIVYADEQVIVVDKPAGLVVHPGSGNREGTLVNGLLAAYPDLSTVGAPDRPGIVHRLDKQTSGLLVVARTAGAHRALVAQMSARTVERRYSALAWGHPESDRGLVDAPIGRSAREPTRMAVSAGGREARTRYEVVETYDDPAALCLLRCRLETGRTHQIRVHLAAIGHPVVGDARYGGRRQPLAGVPRFFLHAEHLEFRHPGSGSRVQFDSELPADLREILQQLA